MKLYRIAREKLVEKNIQWGQVYTEKTDFLKRMYEDTVGPGSYFRFEGDAMDGDQYYCIIGPAKIHAPRAKWFAGVRKLPATYSAGGKYFDSLDAAASYAKETWGVPTPKELKPYTSAKLYGLSPRVTEWKKQNEKEEEAADDKEKDKKDKKKKWEDKKEDRKKKREDEGPDPKTVRKKSSFNLNDFLVTAMSKHMIHRNTYSWWDYEVVEKYNNVPVEQIEDPEIAKKMQKWHDAVAKTPTLANVLAEAEDYRGKDKPFTKVERQNGVYNKLRKLYNMSDEDIEQVFKTYIGYDENYGAHICAVGPYLGNDTYAEEGGPAKDKFGFYNLPVNRQSMNDIIPQAWEAVSKYSSRIPHLEGLDLNTSDLSINFKSLGTNSFGMETSNTNNVGVENLDWKIPLPNSLQLFNSVDRLVRKMKDLAVTDDERLDIAIKHTINKFSIEDAVARYLPQFATAEEYVMSEMGYKSKARSSEYYKTLKNINADREQENAENNPEGVQFNELSPMLRRSGSVVKLNNNGFKKAMDFYINSQGMSPMLDEAMNKVASKATAAYKKAYRGDPEKVREAYESADKGTLKRIYREMMVIGQASGVELLPWGKAFDDRVSVGGSKQFSGIEKVTKIQKRESALRLEVIETMLSEPGRVKGAKETWELMNFQEKRERGRAISESPEGNIQTETEVPYNYIVGIYNELKKEAKDKRIAYPQLLEDMTKMQEQLKNISGFDDFMSAMYMAGLHFTDTRIDYATRAPMPKPSTELVFGFDTLDNGGVNWTTEQISQKRANPAVSMDEIKSEEQEQAEIAKEMDDDTIEELREEDLAEEEHPTEDFPIEEVPEVPENAENPESLVNPVINQLKAVPEQQPQPTQNRLRRRKAPIPTEPSAPEEVTDIEKEKEDIVSNNMKNIKKVEAVSQGGLFKNAVSELKKIAEAQNTAGNQQSSDEINKVIRRYQERV